MSLRRHACLAAAAAAALTAFSCSKAPDDPLCKYDALPSSANVPAGQGAVRISAPTDETFWVSDSAGKEVNRAQLNTAAAVKPGDYVVKLNNSHHTVHVRANSMATCTAGTVLTRGDTDEPYYVLDTTGAEIARNHIGSSLAFFPGLYKVKVNNSTRDVEVKPSAVAQVQTATLTVAGDTDESYYVLDSSGTELARNHLGRPLAFLPGAGTVKVNNTTAPVSMNAATPTVVKTGALLVRGTTDEDYYVYNSVGSEIARQHLNSPLSFLPGAYTVKVNHSDIAAKVEAGSTAEYQTATLTVNGKGDAYYSVLDKNGTELGHNRMNSPLAFAEGSYTVKVGNDVRPVSLTASKSTVLNW